MIGFGYGPGGVIALAHRAGIAGCQSGGGQQGQQHAARQQKAKHSFFHETSSLSLMGYKESTVLLFGQNTVSRDEKTAGERQTNGRGDGMNRENMNKRKDSFLYLLKIIVNCLVFCKQKAKKKKPRRAFCYFTATSSTSILEPLGRAATCTQERAGQGAGK